MDQADECGIEEVQAFYGALAEGDVEKVRILLAQDLEWSFHGPPTHQHLMRILTGLDRMGSFDFSPSRIFATGNRVFAAGGSAMLRWVHIWTVKDSRLVGLRECFNTSVTVTGIKPPSQKSLPLMPSCSTIWQSEDSSSASMPGLVFAV